MELLYLAACSDSAVAAGTVDDGFAGRHTDRCVAYGRGDESGDRRSRSGGWESDVYRTCIESGNECGAGIGTGSGPVIESGNECGTDVEAGSRAGSEFGIEHRG